MSLIEQIETTEVTYNVQRYEETLGVWRNVYIFSDSTPLDLDAAKNHYPNDQLRSIKITRHNITTVETFNEDEPKQSDQRLITI